jgi:hypothetical protein
MKRMLSMACVAATIFFLSQDCLARKWEASLLAGYTMGGSFDEEDDEGGDTGISLNLKESPSFAMAVNTDYEQGSEFEIYYSRQSTELEVDDGTLSGDTLFDLDVHYLQIGGMVILTQMKDVFGETLFQPNGFCDPYIVATVGVAHFRPDDSDYDPETRFSASLGFGTRLRVTDHFGFRMEARGFATFFGGSGAVFSGPQGLRIYVDSTTIGQAVLNAGMYYGF